MTSVFSVVLISFIFVFLGMTMLVLLVSLLSELSFRRTRGKIKRQNLREAKNSEAKIDKQEIKTPRDVSIAISLAVYLNKFLEDDNQEQITMRKSTIPFSPWSTKARGVLIANRMLFFRRK